MSGLILIEIMITVSIMVIVTTYYACINMSIEYDIDFLPIFLGILLLYIIFILFILGGISFIKIIAVVFYFILIINNIYIIYKRNKKYE